MPFDSLPSSDTFPQLSIQSSGQFAGAFAPALRVSGAWGDTLWRRRLMRSTRYISRDELFRVYGAILFANYMGEVLNVEMTIAWKLANIYEPEAVTRALDLFLGRFRKFAAHRKFRTCYYTVHENDRKIGYHTHLALHVPDKYRDVFHRWWRGIETELDKGRDPEDIIFVKFHKEDAVHSQWRWFQYCMKGLDPNLAKSEAKREGWEKLDTNTLAGVWRRETGRIPMKRVRLALAMGKKAQRDACYKQPFYIQNVRHEYKYSDAEYRRGLFERNETLRETVKALNSMDLI
ncbi:hypothetical protein V5F44_07465 [Xanthobacter sp. V2C-8]|uniref:hypothetical protein n=1 Tax=Xanthobacter albus TaxID=3119929 RepID=UPI00372AD8B7